MIYEDDEIKRENHISYDEYKKKVEANPNEGLILFVSAFFVMLIIFLGAVKQLSPDVDVSIDNNASVEETLKTEVDERLKLIQMEDNTNDETFSPELEEKVRLPKRENKTIGEKETPKVEKVVERTVEKTVEKPVETRIDKPVQPQVAQTTPVSAKVVVGYYATAAQAEVAKGIIMDAGLNVQPFIKNIGAAYTLQVGSFNTKEKAQSVANELLKNNFPARVIVE